MFGTPWHNKNMCVLCLVSNAKRLIANQAPNSQPIVSLNKNNCKPKTLTEQQNKQVIGRSKAILSHSLLVKRCQAVTQNFRERNTEK